VPYADNQGISIHYRVEGEGPPFILQHGFTQSTTTGSNSGTWMPSSAITD
jgi:hypothetical protein